MFVKEDSDVDDDEVIENLMNLELDNECKIITILQLPVYAECCHADSVQSMDKLQINIDIFRSWQL